MCQPMLAKMISALPKRQSLCSTPRCGSGGSKFLLKRADPVGDRGSPPQLRNAFHDAGSRCGFHHRLLVGSVFEIEIHWLPPAY